MTMFDAQRRRTIREALWRPWRPGRSKEHENLLPSLQSIQHERLSTREEDIQFLEFWKYEDSDTAQPGVNCFAGIIHDDHVADWLDQRGSFALNKSSPDRPVVGGIRILICEQRGSDPLAFPISRDSYLRMEKHFRLDPATLPYFKNSGYSYAWRHNTIGGRNVLVLICKPPTTSSLPAAGLSLTHDFNTSTTTAFLYGPNLLSSPATIRQTRAYPTSPLHVPQVPLLRELLEQCASLWAHPLLLPTALCAIGVERTQAFCGMELEERFGEVEGGFGGSEKKGAEAMTREVKALATEVAGGARVIAWLGRYASALAEMVEKVEQSWEVGNEEGAHEVRSMVGQLAMAVGSLEEDVKVLKGRADLLVDSLRNSLTQTTNLLAAQLTATATRDGASVNTIALLTTLFLPAIFVATLITTFTCSTHTNQSASASTSASPSTNPLLSKNLRTYWSTAIPLTLLLLLAWLFWRARASKLFAAAYAAILAGRDPHRPSPPPKTPSAPAQLAAPTSTATAIAASTVAGVPGMPGVGGGGGGQQQRAKERGGEDEGRVRERKGKEGVVPEMAAAGGAVPEKRRRMSFWPTGPSGVSAPEAAGWRGGKRQEREGHQEDVERLV